MSSANGLRCQPRSNRTHGKGSKPRSVPLRAGLEMPAGEGTVYVVSGGAGADLYGNDLANPFTAVASAIEHYVLITVDGTSATVEAIDLAGNVIDWFQVPVAPS